MFAKLLKYDMKSVGKIGIPAIIVTLVAGFIGFLISSVFSTLIFFMGDMINWNVDVYLQGTSDFLMTLSDILMALYTLTIFGTFVAFFLVFILISVVGTVILVITVVNFYKTLLTDEGYLTFTLPVSPTTILCSKLTNSVIWNIFGSVAQIVSAFAMIIPFFVMSIAMEIRYPSPSAPTTDGLTAAEIISDVISWLGTAGSFITTLILALVMIVATQLLYFFAVFLGGVVAKKHKLIAGAGFVILAHIIFTTLQQGVQFFVTAVVVVLSIAIAASAALLEAFIPIDGVYVITSSTTVIIAPVANLLNILIFGVIAIILFILTNYLMNKKLNLP